MLDTTLGVDVIGVVRPEAAQAVAITRTGRIGLLATRATVASGSYERAVAAVDPHVSLTAVACPDLAPLIQDPPRGEVFTHALEEVVRGYCAPLVAAGVDTVMLGCTHYPLVRPMLQRMLGRDVAIVTSGAALARQAEHALRTRGLETRRGGEGIYRFLCTGDVDAFRALGTRFLQMPLTEVEHVDLAPIPTAEVTSSWPRP
jgi:glutamate racemase